MTEAEVLRAIEIARGGLGYAAWTVGITDDPGRSRAEHDNPVGWRSWRADSEPPTRRVEQAFRDQGMKESPAGGSASIYVYISEIIRPQAISTRGTTDGHKNTGRALGIPGRNPGGAGHRGYYSDAVDLSLQRVPR